MKILTIVGTRPQLIKVGAVSRVLRNSFTEILVNTGQHYDYKMAGIFFDELKIPKPDYDLGIGSDSHGKQTGRMMMEIEEVVVKEKPDMIIVYGDTNSTLAGAVVAAKMHIPIVHIEAGLRSYNRRMPEEINRVLTDHISTLLFVPSNNGVKNLHSEGIEEGVHQVGDVMYDAVKFNIDLAEERYLIEDFGLQKRKYILGTIHRAENTDDPLKLKAILTAFAEIEDVVYLPLHPRTKKMIKENGYDNIIEDSKNIKIVEPISYLEMLFLEKNALVIVTDSGGVQKEAYFAKVPCITLRNETEWIETIETGWNQLVDPLRENLTLKLSNLSSGTVTTELYGDGHASEKIVKIIREYLLSNKN